MAAEQEPWTSERRDGDDVPELACCELVAVDETATTVVERPDDRNKRCRSSLLTMTARAESSQEVLVVVDDDDDESVLVTW